MVTTTVNDGAVLLHDSAEVVARALVLGAAEDIAPGILGENGVVADISRQRGQILARERRQIRAYDESIGTHVCEAFTRGDPDTHIELEVGSRIDKFRPDRAVRAVQVVLESPRDARIWHVQSLTRGAKVVVTRGFREQAAMG